MLLCFFVLVFLLWMRNARDYICAFTFFFENWQYVHLLFMFWNSSAFSSYDIAFHKCSESLCVYNAKHFAQIILVKKYVKYREVGGIIIEPSFSKYYIVDVLCIKFSENNLTDNSGNCDALALFMRLTIWYYLTFYLSPIATRVYCSYPIAQYILLFIKEL